MASAEEPEVLARARERRMDAGQLSRAVEGGATPWASEFARSLDSAKPFDALEEVFAHKVAELQADAMGKADAMVRRITRDVEERSEREAKLSLQAALKEAEQARAHAEAAVMAATARADAEVAEVRCQAKRTIAELRLKVKEASEDAKKAEAELRQERIRSHAERRAHYSERADLEGEVARLRAELAAMSSRLAEDRMHNSYAGSVMSTNPSSKVTCEPSLIAKFFTHKQDAIAASGVGPSPGMEGERHNGFVAEGTTTMHQSIRAPLQCVCPCSEKANAMAGPPEHCKPQAHQPVPGLQPFDEALFDRIVLTRHRDYFGQQQGQK